jgi:hypothetical protein
MRQRPRFNFNGRWQELAAGRREMLEEYLPKWRKVLKSI